MISVPTEKGGKMMEKLKSIRYVASTGQLYEITYHRSPWWNGEKKTLRNRIKKLLWWHWQFWVVYGKCRAEIDHGLERYYFPHFRMCRKLRIKAEWWERVKTKDGADND